MVARRSWFRRWFGGKPERGSLAPAPSPVTHLPQTLGSEEEVFLAQLVQDLGDGKRRDQAGSRDVLAKLDGLWKSGHERLAIEWMEKLLGVPEVPAEQTAPVRAVLVERYEQRGELDTALPHLEQLIATTRTRCARTTCSPSTLAGEGTTSARYATTRPCSAATSTTRTCGSASSGCASSPAAPHRSPARRSRPATSSGSRLAHAIASCASSAAARPAWSTSPATPSSSAMSRSSCCTPTSPAPSKQGALDRFFHEARVMASLRHPNVVAVLDLDEASRRIVMELAAGGTLRDLLRERGPRTLRRAIERHSQVLSALAAAHRRGIVHCDLKPGNLMFRRDADMPGVEVMLGDFGVAHLPDESGAVAAVTRRAEALGTLAYMAPEQRRGEVSSAADVYASAVVLYEMFTGRTPWAREAVMAGTRRPQDFALPRAIFQEAPSLADDVQAHLDRLADADPAKRPSTAQAVAEAQRLKERIMLPAPRSRGAAGAA